MKNKAIGTLIIHCCLLFSPSQIEDAIFERNVNLLISNIKTEENRNLGAKNFFNVVITYGVLCRNFNRGVITHW